MILHDTHFHLDLCEKPEEVVNEIEKAKIYTIAVTNTPSVFFYTKNLSQNKKYVRPALGLHPELAFERKHEMLQFTHLVAETRYIGEVGLDNLRKSKEDYEVQKKVFYEILKSCAEYKDKILTIHSRRAATDVIEMIGQNYPGKIIMHWYSGNLTDLERAIKYGFYFSVNYPMTKSESSKKIIERIPKHRLLIETDGPFTNLNNKSFNPIMSDIILINLLSLNKDLSSDLIYENFKRIIIP